MPIDQPLAQLAMLLFGLGFLWWEVRSMRRKVALHWADRHMILAHRFKMLLSSMLLAILGALFLLKSAGLISSHAAHYALVGALGLGLFAGLYLMFCNAPGWIWRWLGRAPIHSAQ